MSFITCSLGEVLSKTESINPEKQPSRVFQYVDVSSVSKEKLEITEPQRIRGLEAPSRARKLIKKNDVLFATVRPTLRRVAIVPNDLDGEVCSTGYFVLRSNGKVIPKFIFYFLLRNEFMEIMEKIQTGASYPAVTDKQVKEQLISYPPIPIQEKIVAKLDAIFAEIDKATAAAEANAKNAEALFQSYLTQVFERGGEGWLDFTFDELVLDKQVGLVKNTKEQFEDGKFGYFKMNNITSNNKCKLTPLAKVNATSEEVMKYKLNNNDFLFNTRNSVELVGKACVFDGNNEGNILFNNNIMRVRFKPYVNPNFILFLFATDYIKASIEKLKTGTTNVAAIYYKDLKNLKIKIPDIEKQNNLVAKAIKINLVTNALDGKCKERLKKYQSLKQSVLKQAFSGELVKE